MKPGIYCGLSNAEYHGGPGVSKSMLDVLSERSPLHLRHLRSTANEAARVPTPAQAIGTAFHALILEPSEFVKDYCLGLRQSDFPDAIDSSETLRGMVAELNKGRLPKLSTTGTKDELLSRVNEARTAAAKPGEIVILMDASAKGAELKAALEELNQARTGLLPTTGTIPQLTEILRANGIAVTLWADIKAEWMRNNGHRLVLEPEEWDQLHRMRDAVMAHPAARALLTNVPGRAEQSVYWVDEATGTLCRCRPDFWRTDGIVVDVKTTEDASPDAFAKSIGGWRYHVQHPFYMDGVNAAIRQGGMPDWLKAECKAFAFLAVEKNACVVDGKAKGVAVYLLDEVAVDIGRAQYQKDLATYADCLRSDTWPGYSEAVETIELPAWMTRKAA